MKLEQNSSLGAFTLNLDAAATEQFKKSVGDGNDYGGTVSPILPVARSLGALVEQLEGSSGAVHLSETVQFMRPVAIGSKLIVKVSVGSVRQRMGQSFATINKVFELEDGQVAAVAKTVLILGAQEG